MADTELDLGDLAAGKDGNDGDGKGKPGRGAGGRFTGKGGGGKGKGGRPSDSKRASEAGNRIEQVLERAADAREARGDDELAGALREDKGPIAGTVIAAVKPFGAAPLKALMQLLAVVEAGIAFGRISRILTGRLAQRRQRVADERAAAQAEYDASVAAAEAAGQPPPA